ncbi:uncharacterized protein LOC135207965 [Macrobrachium nipponense]|uniref:uncharacterized protein LOC135207965 n=1 Tax=Macrobrachium nipponense TaxID=159736 RepID=UPI0030C7C3EB
MDISHHFHPEIRCCRGNVSLHLDVEISLMTWYSICLSLDLSLGSWHAFVNGDELSQNKTEDPTTSESVIEGGGLLFIGQHQNILGGGFSKAHSLRATLMDFLMAYETLDISDMEKYTACDDAEVMPETFLNFHNIPNDFSQNKTVSKHMELDFKLCSTENNKTIFYADSREYEDANQFCKATGGILTVPESAEENAQILEKAALFEDKCGGEYKPDTFWLGAKWENGLWVTESDDDLTFQNLESPLGASHNTCVSIVTKGAADHIHSGKWISTPCLQERCFACSYTSYPMVLHLRGLCRRSILDTKYILVVDGTGMISFLGFRNSEISYHQAENGSLGYWEISTSHASGATALLQRQSPNHYPIGRNTWEFTRDACGNGGKHLLLTVCGDEGFTCKSGECIRREYRCDVEIDCDDGSDEEDCLRVIFPKNYDTQKVAPRMDYTVPSVLNISMNILLIKEFDVAKFRFTTEAIIKLAWYDERLTFLNLQKTLWKNKVSEPIWTPPIEFLGHGRTSCATKEENEIITIKKQSDGRTDSKKVYEDLMYSGRENALQLTRKVTITSNCLFKLFAFPFDEQHCSVIMKLSYPPEYVMQFNISDEGLQFMGERNLLQYYLKEEHMKNQSIDEYSSVHVRLVFSNLTTYFLTSTYFPTFILLIIGYMSFFFPVDDFNDRIMVALTALLVEAAFFAQTSDSVPQTAYLKLVDIWFVFCIAFLFLVIVILVIINVLIDIEQEPQAILHQKIFNVRLAAVFPQEHCAVSEEEKQEATAKSKKRFITSSSLNTFGKIFFPCLSLLFVVVYFVYAMTYNMK